MDHFDWLILIAVGAVMLLWAGLENHARRLRAVERHLSAISEKSLLELRQEIGKVRERVSALERTEALRRQAASAYKELEAKFKKFDNKPLAAAILQPLNANVGFPEWELWNEAGQRVIARLMAEDGSRPS